MFLVGLTVGFVFYFSGSRLVKNIFVDLMKHRNHLIVEQLERFISFRIKDIEMIATGPLLKNWKDNSQEIKNILLNTRDTYKVFESISFVDEKFITQFDTRNIGIGEAALFKEDLNRTLKLKQSTYNVYERSGFKKKYFRVVTPVFDKSRHIGFVIGRVSTDRLLDIFNAISDEESIVAGYLKSEQVLETDTGIIIYSTVKNHLHLSHEILQKTVHENKNIVSRLNEKEIQANNLTSILSRSPGGLTGPGWILVSSVSSSELEAPFRRLSAIVFLGFLFFCIIAFYLTHWWVERLMRPLEELSDAITKVEKGSFEKIPCEKIKKDEIGILVDCYNQMIERLNFSLAEVSVAGKFAALGEMAAGIAHEINNPLAIIKGSSSIMQRLIQADQKDKAIENLKRINNTVDRIAKIISSLRIYAREATNDPMTNESLQRVIEETVIFCSEKFRVNGVKFDVANHCPDLTINCRPVQISQILLNLLNNAYDAVSELPESWVRLSVTRKDKFVEISVENSGPKIPKHISERLFTPFFTTKEVGKGTGMGLSLSLGIAKSHNGELTLEDSSKHTRFVLRLPLSETVLKVA